MKKAVLAAMLRLSGASAPDHDAIASAIVERAEVEHLDPLLLVALAHHESRFKVGVKNPRTGTRGLFQLSPYWFRGGRLPFVVSATGGSRAALEVAQGARVLRIYFDKRKNSLGLNDAASVLGAWHSGTFAPTRWSRAVVRTWKMLQAEARRS